MMTEFNQHPVKKALLHSNRISFCCMCSPVALALTMLLLC